ncbi:MAG: hypothetical protein KDM91_05750 [Verrucomicrobiae bacterium]|nr:hypothetical protein [Verrucomicrobiae bacterium]MCP5539440.1 hypothetical protein [Akkermansiaceae bacterium]MCP5551114.1 hypothetical protein [Akkermansiaceae bacterium]
MKAARCFPLLPAIVAMALTGGIFQAIGQSDQPKPAASEVPPGMIQMNLKLGIADLEALKETLPDLLSENSRYQILEKLRMIRITDKPENIEAVRKMIEALSVPPTNIRVVVTSRSVGNSLGTTGGLNGYVVGTPGRGAVIVNNPPPRQTPGVIRRQTINGQPVNGPVRTSGGRIVLPRGGVEVGGNVQSGGTDSLVQQSLLVSSGGTAVLEVVREVPLVDFFTRFTAGSTGYVIQGPGDFIQQVFPGGTFTVPEFRWEKIGTQLLVKPVAAGDLITVEVVPRISALVTVNPAKVRERRLNDFLTGADQYITYTQLSTTVTVANGATVTIGGFNTASADFNRHFFGFGSSSGATAGSITLKATIEPAAAIPPNLRP